MPKKKKKKKKSSSPHTIPLMHVLDLLRPPLKEAVNSGPNNTTTLVQTEIQPIDRMPFDTTERLLLVYHSLKIKEEGRKCGRKNRVL
jgi:hypothetical protein